MTEDSTPLTPPEEDQALAAELALGLLEGDEAEAAVARLATDPEFAQAVRDWQERLAGLALGLTPVMAPARARQTIRERLGHAAPPLSQDPTARSPWWRGPLGVLVGLLAVAAVAAFLWLPGAQSPQPPVPAATQTYQVQLLSDQPALHVAATVAGHDMEIALHSAPAPEGRDWEIWWIAPDGGLPVSIGLVPREGTLRMTLPEDLAPSATISLALSDEPEGGSPTGQATGPVIAIAPLTEL